MAATSTSVAAGSAPIGSGASAPSSSVGSSAASGGSGGIGGGTPLDLVYALTVSDLYAFDAAGDVVSQHAFAGCQGNAMDAAVDANGVLFVTTATGLYRADPVTGECTLVALGSYPNSLAVVPQGVLEPNDDTLVGFAFDSYVRVDKQTGTVTTIGNLNAPYQSSGDMVVIGNSAYLTAFGQSCFDCLLRVDMTNGSMIENIGVITYNAVWGLALIQGVLIGFTNTGSIIDIDPATGVGTLIKSAQQSFTGAASD